jgi:hypothetical protein
MGDSWSLVLTSRVHVRKVLQHVCWILLGLLRLPASLDKGELFLSTGFHTYTMISHQILHGG